MTNPPSSHNPARPNISVAAKRRIHFIANCVYGTHLAGGDIHFFELARAAAEAGYDVNFFGGFALQQHIGAQSLKATITLTEQNQRTGIDPATLRGQHALFHDYFNRYRGTLRRLNQIAPDDLVYATTDYWFDVLPMVDSPARNKVMIWHMQAPSFSQILARSRADVDATRLASVHYWASQNRSLSRFARCPAKRLLYVHPNMREALLRRGYNEQEIRYVSFGVDPDPPGATEAQQKIYDAVWIGRVHRQKGIDDLLQTLTYLKQKIPNFRAVMIGKVKSELQPRIEKLGLSGVVDFPGFVSEEEKFRLFRSSRVYLMPSRFEGSPRVIGEALVCRLPVVAYEVETYRPVFGDLLRYVPCYDARAFQREAEDQIRRMRAGENYLNSLDLRQFIENCSWQRARETFLSALGELSASTKGSQMIRR